MASTMDQYERWHPQPPDPTDLIAVGETLELTQDAAERYEEVKAAKLAAGPNYAGMGEVADYAGRLGRLALTVPQGTHRRGRTGSANY